MNRLVKWFHNLIDGIAQSMYESRIPSANNELGSTGEEDTDFNSNETLSFEEKRLLRNLLRIKHRYIENEMQSNFYAASSTGGHSIDGHSGMFLTHHQESPVIEKKKKRLVSMYKKVQQELEEHRNKQ